MNVQITIIGLGRIGTSIGLALADETEQIFRVGYDESLEVARKSEKLGAVDKTHINLHSAVEKADIVVLTLPPNELRKTLETITPTLKDEVVVIDTSPGCVDTLAWAKGLIPGGRYFFKIFPTLNPDYFSDETNSVDDAHKDLFANSLMAIIPQDGTKSEAIQLVTDLTTLLGASPFFSDPYEMDGLMAASQFLPQVISAALINATTEQPGWKEAGKVAGYAYHWASKPIQEMDEIKAISENAFANKENSVRVINNAIQSLITIRECIESQDTEELEKILEQANENRTQWQRQRGSSNWEKVIEKPPMPTSSEMFKHWFGFTLRKTKDKEK